MRPKVQSQLTPFLETVASAPQALLMLDYDGTLAPFHTQRDRAFPYSEAVPFLQEIMRNGRTRLVLITGRDAPTVPPLLNVHPRPEIWGAYGLQRLRTDGSMDMPHLDERTLEGLSDADRWLRYQRLRHTAEFKAASIAVHWRGLSKSDTDNLRARVLLGWRLIASTSGLNLLEFDGGLEIRAPRADKGNAVRILLNEVGLQVPAAYLGDDATDESAFRVMQGRGISVLVRSIWRRTAAQLWLKPPDDLLDFLKQWLQACSQHDTSNVSATAAVNKS